MTLTSLTPVVPGLRVLDTDLGTRLNAVYVVGDTDSLTVFDLGITDTPAELARALGADGGHPSDVRHLLVSHCDVDHFGGLGGARELFPGATRGAHAADAPLMADYEVYERVRARGFRGYGLDESAEALAWTRSVTRTATIDMVLHGGEQLDLGGGLSGEVLHLPGHSAGQIGLHLPQLRAALVSDAVLGAAVPHRDGSPAFPPTYRFPGPYRRSVEHLRSLDLDLLATAHYGIFRGDAVGRFLDTTLAFTERLDALVHDALSAGPATLAALSDAVSPLAGDWPAEGSTVAMAFPVAGHLEAMVVGGVVRFDDEAGLWSQT